MLNTKWKKVTVGHLGNRPEDKDPNITLLPSWVLYYLCLSFILVGFLFFPNSFFLSFKTEQFRDATLHCISLYHFRSMSKYVTEWQQCNLERSNDSSKKALQKQREQSLKLRQALCVRQHTQDGQRSHEREWRKEAEAMRTRRVPWIENYWLEKFRKKMQQSCIISLPGQG